MGIQDLAKTIRTETDAYVERPLISFFGTTWLIDLSIYLYKALKTHGEEFDRDGNSTGKWVHNLVHLFLALKTNGIRPVCIIDGPNVPPEKAIARAKRLSSSSKTAQKLMDVENLLDELRVFLDEIEDRCSVPSADPSFQEAVEVPVGLRTRIREACRKQKDPKKFDAIDYRSTNECLRVLKMTRDKFARQCTKISAKHSEIISEIARAMGIQVMQADGEAETLAAYFCKIYGGYVLSEDTDLLAYGTPVFLSKIDTKTATVKIIEFEDLLSQLGMSYEIFRDFCVMCGCDYNRRAKLPQKDPKKKAKGIGSVTALKLIRKHGSLENIELVTGYDLSPLSYERCRQLFTVPGLTEFSRDAPSEDRRILGILYDAMTIPYDRPIDLVAVERLFIRHRCKFLLPSVKKAWSPREIEFISDDETRKDRDEEGVHSEGESTCPDDDLQELLILAGEDEQDPAALDEIEPELDAEDLRIQEEFDFEGPFEIYTDGSCSKNNSKVQSPGGWACSIIAGNVEKILCGGEDNTTNNRMELTAVIEALRFIDKIAGDVRVTITIHSDSKYICENVKYLDRWASNRWQGVNGEIKNRDLWISVRRYVHKYNIIWKWVKAHNGNEKNEFVNDLAQKETRKRRVNRQDL